MRLIFFHEVWTPWQCWALFHFKWDGSSNCCERKTNKAWSTFIFQSFRVLITFNSVKPLSYVKCKEKNNTNQSKFVVLVSKWLTCMTEYWAIKCIARGFIDWWSALAWYPKVNILLHTNVVFFQKNVQAFYVRKQSIVFPARWNAMGSRIVEPTQEMGTRLPTTQTKPWIVSNIYCSAVK